MNRKGVTERKKPGPGKWFVIWRVEPPPYGVYCGPDLDAGVRWIGARSIADYYERNLGNRYRIEEVAR